VPSSGLQIKSKEPSTLWSL